MAYIVKGSWQEAIKMKTPGGFPAGIGTYKEKTLHSVIKHYFEPSEEFHEMPLGKKIADISNEHGVIEIQTRSFNNLRDKLAAFLPENKVTIVYPYAAVKWLSWLNPDTGEITKRRKSPKRTKVYDAFYELYKIKMFLNHPNLNLYMLGLEVEEIRLLDGWSKDKKSGSTRYERYPISILESLYIKDFSGYKGLIPADIPFPFTNEDFAKYAGISINTASKATNCLSYIGVIKQVGKTNRKKLYNIK